jgi:hypothetical protein
MRRRLTLIIAPFVVLALLAGLWLTSAWRQDEAYARAAERSAAATAQQRRQAHDDEMAACGAATGERRDACTRDALLAASVRDLDALAVTSPPSRWRAYERAFTKVRSALHDAVGAEQALDAAILAAAPARDVAARRGAAATAWADYDAASRTLDAAAPWSIHPDRPTSLPTFRQLRSSAA